LRIRLVRGVQHDGIADVPPGAGIAALHARDQRGVIELLPQRGENIAGAPVVYADRFGGVPRLAQSR
jgi:hypothetical protein